MAQHTENLPTPNESPVLVRGGASGYPAVDDDNVEDSRSNSKQATSLLPNREDEPEESVDAWIAELDSTITTPNSALPRSSGSFARARHNADEATERDRQVVLAQLHNLMLALRSNARFSSRQRFVQATKDHEHILTLNVKELRDRLFSPLAEFSCIPEQALLKPFFAVITSDETTEPITGVALAAFIAFLDLKCSFLTKQGLLEMASVARNSRNEITDLQSHEAILARILQVYVGVIKHPAAEDLPEYEITTMMASAYQISTQGNPSELLRRTSEQAMTDIVSVTYDRQIQRHHAIVKQQAKAKAKAEQSEAVSSTTGGVLSAQSSTFADPSHIPPVQPSCYEGLFKAICSMVLCRGREFDTYGPFSLESLEAAGMAIENQSMTSATVGGSTPIPADSPASDVGSPAPGVGSSPQPEGPSSPTSTTNSTSSFSNVSRPTSVNSRTKSKKQTSQIPVAAIQLQGLCLAHTVLFTLKDALQEAVWCAPLLKCVRNDLCRALLSIACSGDNVVVLSQMLRTMHLVFSFAGDKVVPQLLSFIQNVHLQPMITMADAANVAAASPTHGSGYIDEFEMRERHEMQMESLLELCSDQAFPTFLYYHYDLSTQAPNVFENLCRYLSRNCYHPSSADLAAAAATSTTAGVVATAGAHLNTINVLALDCLLAMLSNVAARAKKFKASGHTFPPTSSEESIRRTRKERLLKFAELLMQDPPKKAVKFLRQPPEGSDEDCFGIKPDGSGWEIGEFLFANKALLDKQCMGDYLGDLGKEPLKPKTDVDPDGSLALQWEADRRDDYKKFDAVRFYEAQRKGFLNCFDYRGKTLIRAVRETVYHMALPRESQKIDRVMEEFAGQWFSANRHESPEVNPFRTQDGAFILSFSIIMLNTDLNSGKMDKPMTLEGFLSMNRGIDGGESLPNAYLEAIYYDIKAKRIIMADNVKAAHDDDVAWSMEVEASTKMAERHGSTIRMRGGAETDMRAYDFGVFQVLWRPCVAAFGTILDACAGSILLERNIVSVEGLRSKFKQSLPKESAIFESGLRGYALCASTANSLQCSAALDHVIISLLRLIPLNIREGYGQLLNLGRSAKSLLALDLLIRQVHQYANSIREAWGDVAQLCHRLYLLGLLSDNPGSLAELSSRLNKPTIMHKRKPGEAIVENLAKRRGDLSGAPPVPVEVGKNPGIAVPQKPQQAQEKGWFSGLWGPGEQSAEQMREKEEEEWSALSRVSSAAPDAKSLFYLFDTLSDEAFSFLMQGLIQHGSISQVGGSSNGGGNAAPFDAFIASHSIQVTVEVAVRNRHRLHLVEQQLQESLERLLKTVFDGYLRAADPKTPLPSPDGNAAAKRKQLQEHWRVIAQRAVDAFMRLIRALGADKKYHSVMLRLLSMITTSIPPTVLGTIVAPSLSACLAAVTAEPNFSCDSADTWESMLNTAMSLAMSSASSAQGAAAGKGQVGATAMDSSSSVVHDRCLATAVAVGLASSRCPMSIFPNLSESIARLVMMTSPTKRSSAKGNSADTIPSQRGAGINTRPSTIVASGEEQSQGGQQPQAGGGWTKITQYDHVSPAALHESSQNLASAPTNTQPSEASLQSILASQPESKAVEALSTMNGFLVDLLEKDADQGASAAATQQWVAAWLGTLRSLCALVFCTHCDGKLGSDALLALQRCMLDRRLLTLSTGTTVLLFSSIVFPLVEKVCSSGPQQGGRGEIQQLAISTINAFLAPGAHLLNSVFRAGQPKQAGGQPALPPPMVPVQQPSPTPAPVASTSANTIAPGAVSAALSEDMHCRCVSLLPKAFLHYFGKLVDDPEFLQLWRRVMGVLFALYTDQRLHSVGSGAQKSKEPETEGMLKEAIQETVRNLIFVLSSMYLVPESKALFLKHTDFWKVSRELVIPFDFSGPLIAHLESVGLK